MSNKVFDRNVTYTSIGLDSLLPMAGVYFEAAEVAQFDPVKKNNNIIWLSK